ncbi:MAG: hypothetical protein FJ286_01990 [Planctomycetes bacterium]|nr:hypothetical protein [Planctomycetota bacterium]
MPRLGMLRSLWLTRLSKPAAERILYRHVLASRPGRILELGLGMLARTERLLEAAAAGVAEVAYVGIDRFESRTLQDPPGVSLKEAHRRLHDRAKVQLVPGNVDSALARTCNHLGVFDLVVISADNDQRHLPRCWFFLQRVTRPQSTVFVESGTAWTTVSREKIDDLASRSVLQRAG